MSDIVFSKYNTVNGMDSHPVNLDNVLVIKKTTKHTSHGDVFCVTFVMVNNSEYSWYYNDEKDRNFSYQGLFIR